MKAPKFETERCILRPYQESDAALWQVWDVDSEIQAHMPEPHNEPQTIPEQLSYIAECEAEEGSYYWSIQAKTGETIGTIALMEVYEYHKVAELGIVIGDKAFWGKGVATEVVQAVVAYAFAELGLLRISAEIEADNIAVAKVLAKTGFTHDGTFVSARVKNGRRIDVLHFGIVKVI